MSSLSFGGLSEPVLRLSVFLGVLAALMALEAVLPRRGLHRSRRARWTTNLSIVVLDGLCLRVLGALAAPLLAVGTAIWAQAHCWGLLNQFEAPAWLEVAVALALFDLLIWAQHRVFHRVPWLWRIHRMHHADPDFDATTALRFHPIEILLSMAIKVVAVLLLGPSAVAVVLFEVMLNACAMFNHANLRLPLWLDTPLRRVLVTPDMHRVHHSTRPGEHHNNFGFSLSVWDRWFGTYVAQPRDGHLDMQIGLSDFARERPESLRWCLAIPFRAAPAASATSATSAETTPMTGAAPPDADPDPDPGPGSSRD